MNGQIRHARSGESSIAHPIVGLERMRCIAVERGDFDSIRKLLSDDLVYVHSNGQVHDRTQFMEYLQGKVKISSVRRSDMAVSHWGSVALCTGRMIIGGCRVSDGLEFSVISFVTQAWTNYGGGWKLSLMQSTKVSESATGCENS